jgi:glycosyltransferase involved in cell wall biosynthesis
MFVIQTLGNGGAEKQLTELAIRLPPERFELAVLAPAEGVDSHLERLRASNISLIATSQTSVRSPLGLVLLTRQYLSAIRSFRPEVVYAWLDEASAVMAPICRVLGIPCLVARRNIAPTGSWNNLRVLSHVVRRAESLSDIVTANSHAVALACVERGHKETRVRMVPNGHEPVCALEPPSGCPVIFGYVARYRPDKGHHRLLDALERMPAGPWRVDLAGDGPLRGEIEARVLRSGLSGRVNCLGTVSDIRDFWQNRHAALLLSDSEGLPNSLLEAAYAGRPVIATDVGGTPEVVGDGGILVPPDDPSATVAAMQLLIYDSDARKRMGDAIRRHVERYNNIDAMVLAHISAIEEACSIPRWRLGRRRFGGDPKTTPTLSNS